MRILNHVLAGLLFLSASNPSLAQDRPQMVAVNHALQYFAERLVGDSAEVVFPVPQDVDPTFWRPAISDITMIQSVDLVLLNGAGFATWVDRVSLSRSKLVNTTAAIEDQFITAESITHSHGEGGEHSHEGTAAYVWLDPTLAIAQAKSIAAAVVARDLAPAAEVEAELAELRTELEALDTEAAEMLTGLEGVPIIATHPRYQYFARRYGLSITSLEWEAGALPTDEQLDDLKALAEETDAQLMIWEATPPDGAFDLTSELGLQNIVFSPLAREGEGSTYFETFADAVSQISQAASQ